MRHLDLCSGIGGFALAARWMGWETIGFAEIDPFCARVLEKHWPGVPNYGDIAAIPVGVGADIVTAGFPCQPFSQAGRRLGAADDRAIWPRVLAAVARVRPAWAVFENVAGIAAVALARGPAHLVGKTVGRFDNSDLYRAVYTRQDVLYLGAVCHDLEYEGFEVVTLVIPACAVGAPHQRDRVWIIAHNARGADRENHARTRGGSVQQPGKRAGEGAFSRDANRLNVIAERSVQKSQPYASRAGCGIAATDSPRVAKRKPADETDPLATRGETRAEPCGGRAVAADADRAGLERRDGHELRERPDQRTSGEGGSLSADADGQPAERPAKPRRQCGPRFAQPGIRGADDGLSAGVDRSGSGPEYWDGDWTRGTHPVSSGVENRTGRLKALGNAIVPQVAFQIFMAIAAAESE